LEDLSALLHQDTAQPVHDFDPAKALVETLRGKIPTDAKKVLFQAAQMSGCMWMRTSGVEAACMSERASES